ncbi:MAG: FtsX-like permease family protein [Pseudomonadota bacterium]
MLLRLAIGSLLNRWMTVALTVFATALSVGLFLGVEKLRTGAKESFANTVSGVDLIVGARSGSVQLLLYSVFRIGNATSDITWESYQDLAAMPEVAWIVPLSLGDSHRGFRVLGTTEGYFEHYRYRGERSLEIAEGQRRDGVFDAVLGASVAAELDYVIGQEIIVAHGISSFSLHDDRPFRVAGILAPTGTPVDRTVHVSLAGIEAIHVDWRRGARLPGIELSTAEVLAMDLSPRSVTAALVGLKSRRQALELQRRINTRPEEPLLAILPGMALQELWSLVGVAETALAGVSGMVVGTALLGMAAMILAGLGERRREMAILRAVGARPRVIVAMLVTEAAVISTAGTVLGLALLYAAMMVVQPWLDAQYGLFVAITPPGADEALILISIVVAGTAVGLLPALRAYRLSLADGMTVAT